MCPQYMLKKVGVTKDNPTICKHTYWVNLGSDAALGAGLQRVNISKLSKFKSF